MRKVLQYFDFSASQLTSFPAIDFLKHVVEHFEVEIAPTMREMAEKVEDKDIEAR